MVLQLELQLNNSSLIWLKTAHLGRQPAGVSAWGGPPVTHLWRLTAVLTATLHCNLNGALYLFPSVYTHMSERELQQTWLQP